MTNTSLPGRCNLIIMGSYDVEKTLMVDLLFGNRRFDEWGKALSEDDSKLQYRYLETTKVLLKDFIQREDFRPYHFSEYGNFFHDCHYFLFVFNFYESQEVMDRDLDHYVKCLSKLHEKAPTARVFVMLHKKKTAVCIGDYPVTIPWKTEGEYQALEEMFRELTKTIGQFEKYLTIYRTNIDNSTHFTAWSAIMRTIREPLASWYDEKLEELVKQWGVDEVVLYEAQTLFIVSQAGTTFTQPQRLEKIAISLKRFSEKHWQPSRPLHSLNMRTADFQLVVEPFYQNTYLMVVTKNMEADMNEMIQRIKDLRKEWEAQYGIHPYYHNPYY